MQGKSVLDIYTDTFHIFERTEVKCPFLSYLSEISRETVSKECLASPKCFLKHHIYKCIGCSDNVYIAYPGIWFLHGPREIVPSGQEAHDCYQCPAGGICLAGKVLPLDNYWGYVRSGRIHFIRCLEDYCCTKALCVSYSSCSEGRNGFICSMQTAS